MKKTNAKPAMGAEALHRPPPSTLARPGASGCDGLSRFMAEAPTLQCPCQFASLCNRHGFPADAVARLDGSACNLHEVRDRSLHNATPLLKSLRAPIGVSGGSLPAVRRPPGKQPRPRTPPEPTRRAAVPGGWCAGLFCSTAGSQCAIPGRARHPRFSIPDGSQRPGSSSVPPNS